MKQHGFTLIELMVVVVLVTIIMTIAIPSYQAYIKRNNTAQTQQEILKIVEQLERYKSRNFSYRGFDAKYLYKKNSSVSSISFPDEQNPKYILSIADISDKNPRTLLTSDNGLGRKWGVRAIPTAKGYEALLVTSLGIRCKAEYWVENDLKEIMTYSGCGLNAKTW